MGQQSQLALLGKKRFLPFFLTQFLGAFNDNLYKNSLLLMAAFAAAESLPFNSDLYINLAAGLFILPFFLFSSAAGQICDKYEKSMIIRRIKLLEIVIMAVASGFILTQNYLVLLTLLFLMGIQSAFFGPVKYAIIPQHLNENELMGGNALVEMGTFVAILAGTLGAGILTEQPDATMWIAISVVLFAILGYLASLFIPKATAAAPDLKINWNLFQQSLIMIRKTRSNDSVHKSIIAISWFWALGAAYLTQLPNLASETLKGSPEVVSIMLAMFIIGVAAGSLFCGQLSKGRVEPGIVPIGALGLSLFGIDLYFAITPATTTNLLSISAFVENAENLRVLLDLGMIGFFSGLFIVPLYAMVQQRTPANLRAQTIAALNVQNSFYMVVSALFGMVCLGVLQLSIEPFFLTLGVLNLLVCALIFRRVPEFIERFVARFVKKVAGH
ncbi:MULTISPECIES: MFS transporter [unclassified Endozoicomonas]|uniref:MFS transporter n=1 Tax=unclassified Endozoicomonas TaxID=2644528 RepID=UPI0021478CA0|nr:MULTISPECIES: MFS transporter [unclassified Endozoicomonas]